MPPYIQDANESWSVEFVDEKSPFTWTPGGTTDSCPYQLRLTHNVSAVGKSVYDAGGLTKDAWRWAQDWVVPKLGFNSEILNPSGVLNLDSSAFVPYNHVRTNTVDATDGSFGVTESWIVINSGAAGVAGNATEDFTIDVSSSIDTPFTTVTINGTVQGLETRTYGTSSGDFNIDEYKYTAASGYFATVKGRFYNRAKEAANITAARQLNINPMTTSIGHSVCDGMISYTYTYNDRPQNIVPGSLSESIQISDNHPTDLFASHVILGRTAGPLLQNLNTITAPRRSMVVEIVTQPPTGAIQSGVPTYLAQSPKEDVSVLVEAVAADLSGTYSGVFKTQDASNWTPLEGRFSRSVEWTYVDC
jgi:hypothetical protein